MTKAHQLAGAATVCAIAWEAWWRVQNGLVKDDILTAAFGAERVLGMATIYSAGRRPGGEVLVPDWADVRRRVGWARVRQVRECRGTWYAAGVPTEVRVRTFAV
jgi:hypothetical protein